MGQDKPNKSSDVQCGCCGKWVDRDDVYPFESPTSYPHVISGRTWVCEACMPKE